MSPAASTTLAPMTRPDPASVIVLMNPASGAEYATAGTAPGTTNAPKPSATAIVQTTKRRTMTRTPSGAEPPPPTPQAPAAELPRGRAYPPAGGRARLRGRCHTLPAQGVGVGNGAGTGRATGRVAAGSVPPAHGGRVGARGPVDPLARGRRHA